MKAKNKTKSIDIKWLQGSSNPQGFGKSIGLRLQILAMVMLCTTLTGFVFAVDDEEELPFGGTAIIIELTDNDIELQAFVDGVEWKRLQVFGPNERRIFNLRAERNLSVGKGV